METIHFRIYKQARKWLKQKQEDDLLINQIKSPPWSGVTAPKERGQVEINCANTAIEMAHQYTKTHGKEEVKLLEEYKEHEALFSDEEAKKFPPFRPWDHKIELTEDTPASFNCKIYPMSRKEQEAED